MCALRKPSFVPQLISPYQHVPNACPAHPDHAMELVTVLGVELWRCTHPAHDTGSLKPVGRQQDTGAIHSLTIRERAAAREARTPQKPAPVPPTFLVQKMAHVEYVGAMQTLLPQGRKVPNSPELPDWMQVPLPEAASSAFSGPLDPNIESIHFEAAPDIPIPEDARPGVIEDLFVVTEEEMRVPTSDLPTLYKVQVVEQRRLEGLVQQFKESEQKK